MKREKFLWPLTQGHQRALMGAKNIRERLQSMKEETRAGEMKKLLQETQDFWDTELRPHFKAEEELLKIFARHVGPEDQDLRRILEDHRVLEEKVRGGRGEDLLSFSELLTAHIRYEEETVFGRIEKSLNQEEIIEEDALLKKSVPACPKIPGRKNPP